MDYTQNYLCPDLIASLDAKYNEAVALMACNPFISAICELVLKKQNRAHTTASTQQHQNAYITAREGTENQVIGAAMQQEVEMLQSEKDVLADKVIGLEAQRDADRLAYTNLEDKFVESECKVQEMRADIDLQARAQQNERQKSLAKLKTELAVCRASLRSEMRKLDVDE